MNENRDQEVARLLREYQQELRGQAPAPAVLDRIRAASADAAAADAAPGRKPVVAMRPRRTSRRASRWVWSGLAVAASLLLAFGLYWKMPGGTPAASGTVVELAAAQVKPAPAQARSAAPQAVAETEQKAPARASAKAPPPAPMMDPAVPPSIRAALAANMEKNVEKSAEKKARLNEAPRMMADAAAPGGGASAAAANSTEKIVREEAARDDSAGGRKAEASRPEPGRGRLAVRATLIREVLEPGQVARVLTGSYARSAEGVESFSGFAPVEASALSQQAMPPAANAAPPLIAEPSQTASPMTMPREQRRVLSPVRDQIAAARAKMATPHVTSLGTAMVEGFRCVGTRTVDGQRAVERWRAEELGLDLLVRTTEASGAQVLVRYVNIERRP